MKPSNNLENKTPSDILDSIRITTGVQSRAMPLASQGSLWPFYPSLELRKYYAVSDYF